MSQYPPFSPSELSAQRWYVALAIMLCVWIGAMVWWRFRRRTAGPSSFHWMAFPMLALLVLDSGSSCGVTSEWLVSFFAIHCGLTLVGVGIEVRDDRTILYALPLVIIFLGVILLPGVTTPKWTARFGQCKNNLKQLGLAIHNFNDAEAFQPVTGDPPMSWRVKLLPFLDAAPLATGYDSTQPWDSSANRSVGIQEPQPYRCPSHQEDRTQDGLACTDYALLTGRDTIFPTPTSELNFKAIPDGLSSTILMVECSGLRIPWTEPRDVDVGHVRMTINELGSDGGSPSIISGHDANPSHTYQQCHILLADGSVRRVDHSTMSPEIIRSLMTPNGGEPSVDF